MSLFIALEGLDGSGTTTQSARLAAWLRNLGHTVHTSCEPSEGPVGQLIRASLRQEPGSPDRSTLPWLFSADRADHLHRDIEPALAAGTIAITDRYAPSSLAYQSMEIPMDQVYVLNASFRVPDLVLFHELDVDVALSRIGSRGEAREIFEHRSQLERVAKHYREAMAYLDARGWPITTLDASLPIDDVTLAIQAAVTPLLPTSSEA